MYCRNCGKELKDGVKFCTSCGSPVSGEPTPLQSGNAENAETAVKKDKKNFKYIIAFAAAAIIIICGAAVSVSLLTSGGDDTSDKNMTAEQQLLDDYFSNSVNVNDYVTPDGNIAEHLVRGQSIFDGFKVIYSGTVNSLLSAEGENGFAVSIESEYYYSNASVLQIVAIGTYDNSGTRLMEGDYVTVVGDFSGVEMYENVDGSNAEYAVLRNCHITEDPEYPEGFEESEVRTVITSIFGQDCDIRKDTEVGARSTDTYTFTRVVGNRMENWSFSEYGNCTVSFDGGANEYNVIFAPDYKSYLTRSYINAPYTLRCYEIGGTELWSKEFSSTPDCIYKNDRLYVYGDNDLYIMDPQDGSDIISPKYYADRNMFVTSDRILLRDYSGAETDAVLALDPDGNMIWRANIDNGFDLSDMAVSSSGGELLLTYIYNDMDTYETYCRYKRINLETGETTATFKMPDDHI